jgi:hypothetical protein
MTDQPFDGKQRWIELGVNGSDTKVVLFTPDGHQDRIGTVSNVVFRDRRCGEDLQRTHRSRHGV